MSEYQYYEFQAIDRPLNEQQQAYVRGLSRRVEMTPSHARFTYSYGDFPANPLKVLEAHFDALLYEANWGSKRLAFRFPRAAIDLQPLMPYYFGVEEISLTTSEQHVILDFDFNEEGGGGWIEEDASLGSMVLLRQDILRGDLRSLYLAWLKAAPRVDEWDDELYGADDEDDASDGAEADEDDSLREPPVPAGLGQLSAPLQAFAAFFEIDADLIAAAAEASPPLDPAVDEIERWVLLLPEAERNAFLVRVARGEPLVDVQLVRRLREVGGKSSTSSPEPVTERRTIDELLAAAEQRKQQRKKREREEARRARLRQLEALAQREPAAWTQVEQLIARKNASAYDEAVALLVDLRDLANHRREQARFDERIAALESEYAKRPSLLERFRKAGLIKASR